MPVKNQTNTEKTNGTDTQNEEEKRLDSIISAVGDAAVAKGWYSFLQVKDKQNFRYATINVSREDISGTLEITRDKTVILNAHATSFHSHGLKDLREAAWNEITKLPFLKPQEKKENLSVSAGFIIEKLLRNFHRMTRQLKHRHDDREPFLINDEYDIQDFLHVLLRGFFDDVRAEEYTPSYAGGSSRLDFLLKKEQIVIETKISSASLRDKKVGEQLLVDIGRYQAHPDCKKLICFVYDPQNYLKNPNGLENDLSKAYDQVDVSVIVVSP